ncbi:MAG: prephenate dehydratase [Microbacteriaceae bacterium]|nr:prephenate dehydratase [Microbacteriaceae bacterium]
MTQQQSAKQASGHGNQLRRYSYLGPAGTFTEAALAQAPQAQGQEWVPVANINQALENVVSGHSDAAMVALENSIDGGVTAVQDALASLAGVQILGEYLVPVNFVVAQRPGSDFARATTVAAHPVAYAQCRKWLETHLPQHRFVPASSNSQAALDLLNKPDSIDVALTAPTALRHYPVEVYARNVASDDSAITRFALVGRRQPVGQPSGHDRTSLIVELAQDRAGALLELLEQFAARGVNLTQIASRPLGKKLGQYRFHIDAEGHIREERVRQAIMGLQMRGNNVLFLGSYARADKIAPTTVSHQSDAAFRAANAWIDELIAGKN